VTGGASGPDLERPDPETEPDLERPGIHDPTTGGMRSEGPEDEAPRSEEADLFGAASGSDIHEGFADTPDLPANLSPDEAAEVLFGEDAPRVRAFAHHGSAPDANAAAEDPGG
jgi:hypothetical protein